MKQPQTELEYYQAIKEISDSLEKAKKIINPSQKIIKDTLKYTQILCDFLLEIYEKFGVELPKGISSLNQDVKTVISFDAWCKKSEDLIIQKKEIIPPLAKKTEEQEQTTNTYDKGFAFEDICNKFICCFCVFFISLDEMREKKIIPCKLSLGGIPLKEVKVLYECPLTAKGFLSPPALFGKIYQEVGDEAVMRFFKKMEELKSKYKK